MVGNPIEDAAPKEHIQDDGRAATSRACNTLPPVVQAPLVQALPTLDTL